jgi:hypothetical protein
MLFLRHASLVAWCVESGLIVISLIDLFVSIDAYVVQHFRMKWTLQCCQ